MMPQMDSTLSALGNQPNNMMYTNGMGSGSYVPQAQTWNGQNPTGDWSASMISSPYSAQIMQQLQQQFGGMQTGNPNSGANVGAKGQIPNASGYSIQDIYRMAGNPALAQGTPFAGDITGGNGNGPVGFNRSRAMQQETGRAHGGVSLGQMAQNRAAGTNPAGLRQEARAQQPVDPRVQHGGVQNWLPPMQKPPVQGAPYIMGAGM